MRLVEFVAGKGGRLSTSKTGRFVWAMAKKAQRENIILDTYKNKRYLMQTFVLPKAETFCFPMMTAMIPPFS